MIDQVSPYLPRPGARTELVEFASGGRRVQGALFSSTKEAARDGVLLVHGVESFWYAGPSMFLACGLADHGYATLAYNGVHSGQGFRLSNFEDAVAEVGDAISFFKARGVERVFLAGHSLGTPIVQSYAGGSPDASLAGIGLYGPHISIPEVTRDSLLGPQAYARFRDECRALVTAGRGDEIQLLPYRGSRVIVTSARSFLSYRDVDTSKATVSAAAARIRVPVAIFYDRADNIQGLGAVTLRETIARRIVEAAIGAPRVDVEIIPSTEGNTPVEAHSFLHKEHVVVERTASWLRSISPTDS